VPDFGVTDAGYVLPTQQQLLDLIAADQKALVNPDVDTSSDSVLGQLNGVVTRQLMIGYEAQQAVYNSNDPDVVEGFLQTMLAKLTGTPRDGATPSTVTLTCDLVAGTTLLAGITLASVPGNPSSQWTPKANYTALSTGALPVDFVNVATGPNEADTGTITVMTTTVVGWNSVINGAPAVPGTNGESDPALRIRREQELQGGGAGNVDAIRAALLKINEPTGPFVVSADVLNNYTDVVDPVNGLPPHSIEAVIWDRSPPQVDDTKIAQVLWDNGAAGIRNFGTSSGTATDKLGNPQLVAFTRVTQRPIFLAIALTPRAGYPGDVPFATALANILRGDPDLLTPEDAVSFGVGDSVDPYDIVLDTGRLGAKVVGLSIGFSAPATPSAITTTILAIGPREIGTFDSVHIAITHV
jgi:hypothetical protein